MAELSSAHLLGIVFLLSLVTLFGNQFGVTHTDAQEMKTPAKMSKFAAPTLKFLYW